MIKRTNRLALAAMRGVAIVRPLEQEGKGVELRNSNGRQVQANELHWHCVERMQHVWWLGLAVQTERCTHVEIVSPPAQCRHTQLIESLQDTHAAMIKEYQDAGVKVTGFGWVASISELSEESVMRYLGVEL